MSDRGDIPASTLLSVSLDELERIRMEARADARRHNAQLAWICAALLAIVVLCGVTAFSLVVRNNLVILPDRSRKTAPAGERPEVKGERPAPSPISDLPSPMRGAHLVFRRLDPANLVHGHKTPAAAVAVLCGGGRV